MIWNGEGKRIAEHFTPGDGEYQRNLEKERLEREKPKEPAKKEKKRPLINAPFPPGTLLHYLIASATIGVLRPCAGCDARKKMMDNAGWLKAWKLPFSKSFWKGEAPDG